MEQIKLLKIKYSGDRATLLFNQNSEELIVAENTARENKLVEGIIITTAQFEILSDESQYYLGRKKAKQLLAMRAHSVGELKRKLSLKKIPEPIIKKIINRLTESGLLDDYKYATNSVRVLMERKPSGRAYLIAHLRRKMVAPEIAAKVVDSLLENFDATGQALLALEKRRHVIEQLELEDARRKAYNYLSRRGFGYEAAKNAFELFAKNKNED